MNSRSSLAMMLHVLFLVAALTSLGDSLRPPQLRLSSSSSSSYKLSHVGTNGASASLYASSPKDGHGHVVISSLLGAARTAALTIALAAVTTRPVFADEIGTGTVTVTATTAAVVPAPATAPSVDLGKFKVPLNHENIPFRDFLGKKATIVFNMKLDDPQTVTQFPALTELSKKYAAQGLNVLAFPTEQGWFEPDDDETVRLKAAAFYDFGNKPGSAVFDKVDFLGPSANPMIDSLARSLPTPNGYSRITLNYEKFLLDADGHPLRRYPRRYSPFDMENDLVAVLAGQPIPEETPLLQKAWREAKREVGKSEYSFRFNYNYYDAPDSMYKYDQSKDKL